MNVVTISFYKFILSEQGIPFSAVNFFKFSVCLTLQKYLIRNTIKARASSAKLRAIETLVI